MSQNPPSGSNKSNRFTSPNPSGGGATTPQTPPATPPTVGTTTPTTTAGGGRFTSPGQTGASVPPGTNSGQLVSPQTALTPPPTPVPLPTPTPLSLVPGGTRVAGAGPSGSQMRLPGSLIDQAMKNDQQAIYDLFAHFLPPQEPIITSAYLGRHGMWWYGTRSFCCLTERRIASLQVGRFGEVVYQDGYMEHINSGVVYQPSRLSLYIMVVLLLTVFPSLATVLLWGPIGFWALAVGAMTLVCCCLLLPVLVRLYYTFNKCGVVFWIREGVAIYIFANRNRLSLANDIYRAYTELRDRRLAKFGHP